MQVVTGVFKSENNAETAVTQLRSLGIPDKRIGIVRPGTRPERIEAGVPVTDSEEPGMGRAMGAAVGGAMGAAGGATAGLAVASLVIPGIGPLIAFGMVGAGLLGIVGAAAGSAVGDSVEEELGEGIPHEDVYLYEDALRHGRSVVIAYVEEGDQADNAAKAIHDAGAEDLRDDGSSWEVTTPPEVMEKVREALAAAQITPSSAEVAWVPKNNVKLSGAQAQQMLRMVETLEDHDDVQHVYANFDIDEKEIAAMAG